MYNKYFFFSYIKDANRRLSEALDVALQGLPHATDIEHRFELLYSISGLYRDLEKVEPSLQYVNKGIHNNSM